MKNNVLKIIKVGGNIIDNPIALKSLLKTVSTIEGPKILVHGGGKSATDLAEKMGIEVKMIEGRRLTDAATLELITMVSVSYTHLTLPTSDLV